MIALDVTGNKLLICDRSCTDLGDNDMELIVVRGLNYNLPSGMHKIAMYPVIQQL